MTLLSTSERGISAALSAVRLDSIRSKILAFALAATLIPAVSTSWVSYRQNERALTENITQELKSASSQVARELDLWILGRFFDVRVFAASFVVTEDLERVRRGARPGPRTLSRLHDYLNSVQERFSDYVELLVLDPSAQIVATTAAQPSTVELPQDWSSALESGNTIPGAVAWDENLEQPIIVIAAPIRATDGRLLGAMTAKLGLRSVDEILKRFAPGESGRAYLITRLGQPIVSSRSGTAAFTETPLSTATIGALVDQALVDKETAPLEYTANDGQPVVGTLRRIPRLNWAVIAEIPKAEAFAQVTRLRNLTILIVTGLLLAVGFIAYLLGFIIVRPLNRLTKGAVEVAGGDLAVDLPVVGGGEVAYLTEVFNDMVARLREDQQEIATANEALSKQNEELERLSVTDALTGLHNRRHLMVTLASEVRRSHRHEHTFAVLMTDVDHFKKYNDTHGHVAGDQVLARVGSILKQATREVDCAARYGGEEFLLLLPETDVEGGVQVAERIRESMAKENFGPKKKSVAVTLSVGVAEFPVDGDSPELVIASADAALYQAKRRGRNRVVRTPRKRRRPKGA